MSNTSQNVIEIISAFESHFELLRIYESKRENKLIGLCKAALTKAFEFVQISISNQEKNEFFHLSGLRGICEELIATSYIIKELSEQQINDLFEFQYSVEQEKSLLKQFNFFWKYKPMQCVVPPKITELEDKYFQRLKNDLKGNESKKIAKEKNIELLPSTWKMAEQTNYQDLYQFIFNITSASVHFRIDNFFKLGWGELDQHQQIEKTEFSTKHEQVQHYCKEFNICYGIILFVEMSSQFKETLKLQKDYESKIESLVELIQKNRFPPFITHQHMNWTKKEMKDKYIEYAEKYAI